MKTKSIHCFLFYSNRYIMIIGTFVDHFVRFFPLDAVARFQAMFAWTNKLIATLSALTPNAIDPFLCDRCWILR